MNFQSYSSDIISRINNSTQDLGLSLHSFQDNSGSNDQTLFSESNHVGFDANYHWIMNWNNDHQGTTVRVEFGDATTTVDPSDEPSISRSYPNTYGHPLAHFLRASAKVSDAQIITEHPPIMDGIVFCCRQSPGGHNVIWGLQSALNIHNPKSVLLGFLGGSEGLFAHKTLEITDSVLSTYKNQGGYDLLGRTKDQIKTTEQVNAALAACNNLKLEGLVIIGGVTPNTNAAQPAETFVVAKCPTKVVGVPVTSNGDLKNQFVEANVGFDTIYKVNSQLINNVCTDALSAEKYYYFIRLMGRKASHVALERTLQSHPNMSRARQIPRGILLPEGLIESIPEVYALLKEIHGLLRQGVVADKIFVQLSPWASALFEFLPPFIRRQPLLYPESDDSAQLSQIGTEKLLAYLVEAEINKRDYAYVLGHICYHILAVGLNGYMATITNLKNPVNKWKCGAAPISSMMTVKRWSPNPGATSIGKPPIHPATMDL
ncbi:hypothetical protein KIW84_011844 [Lathyrus oleraceus]|uniref:Phosphofructokinase domain-containing protein n=1 Tax=Pisum sativum TaxID=3888 RepID=A0A9D5BG32_PEA|nr:hypothetical protein KIW84_011844 [Pisum sativum]